MIKWIRVHWWWVVGLVLSGYKLSLLRSQHIYALGAAQHDEGLFMKLAGHIARGEWLGPYDHLTLAKGPAYSIFIAMNFWAGLPLALTQQVFYLAACLMVLWALAPVIKLGWARLAVWLLLFYNPLTYEGENMTRILRQHLSVPLALIIVAGLIALVLRRKDFRWDVTLPCAALTGAALGVFFSNARGRHLDYAHGVIGSRGFVCRRVAAGEALFAANGHCLGRFDASGVDSDPRGLHPESEALWLVWDR